jgi:hypothetical protein
VGVGVADPWSLGKEDVKVLRNDGIVIKVAMWYDKWNRRIGLGVGLFERFKWGSRV